MSELAPLDEPCVTCPWRKDRTALDIPNFDLEAAERLSSTCPDKNGFGPDFDSAMFACHCTKEGKEFACAGWLAQVGVASPAARWAVAAGAIESHKLMPGKHWPELHETYIEVLEKLRATTPDQEH